VIFDRQLAILKTKTLLETTKSNTRFDTNELLLTHCCAVTARPSHCSVGMKTFKHLNAV